MLITGHLLLESDRPDSGCRLARGCVRVDGDRITEVVELEEDDPFPTHADEGGPSRLITPGFVDTHLHLPQFDMIGAHGLPLLGWLDSHTFPNEQRWADAGYAEQMTHRVAKQLHAHGATAVCAYSSVHHEATEAACRVLEETGFRGWVGQSMNDRNAPAEILRERSDLLDQTAGLISRWPAERRISAAITPRFAVSCSEELLAGAGQLAGEQSNTLVQTHLSETRAECELIGKLFSGRSYVQVYADHGLVTDRTLFGHGIWLDARERRELAQAKATVAHCPTANSFLRSGSMNRARLRDSEVTVSLGSDIGAGYERSMVRVARAMVETAAAVGDTFPTAADAWRQITAGNAETLRLECGRLRAGDLADLLVVEPDIAWLKGGVDPLAMLLFAWDDRWLKRTIAGGRVVFGRD